MGGGKGEGGEQFGGGFLFSALKIGFGGPFGKGLLFKVRDLPLVMLCSPELGPGAENCDGPRLSFCCHAASASSLGLMDALKLLHRRGGVQMNAF